MIMKKYDIVIIGAGISGIMLAYRVIQKNKNLNIALIDKGSALLNRHCPVLSKQTIHCLNCKSCSIMCGFAGAGAFSDGKFIISTEYGGNLASIIGESSALYYMQLADEILSKYSGPQKIYIPNDALMKLCSENNLQLKKGIVKHFGTENNLRIMKKLLDELETKCTFMYSTNVIDIDPETKLISLENSHKIFAQKIIFAVGRSGNNFLNKWCQKNHIKTTNNNVDIGVRVELKNETWEKISAIAYDPKISYISKKYNDETRMFCFNQGGQVVLENTFGTQTVNGHAYSETTLKSDNCNFALLSSIKFTSPFNNPTDYICHLVSCSNIISGNSVIIQRFGDLINGQRTTDEKLSISSIKPTLNAYPGDLSLCLPKRQLDNIIETIHKLDSIAPGTANDDTLLYGIEGKYYSSVPDMDNFQLEGLLNIYACGDGCGATRSLAQAAANGLYLADHIDI